MRCCLIICAFILSLSCTTTKNRKASQTKLTRKRHPPPSSTVDQAKSDISKRRVNFNNQLESVPSDGSLSNNASASDDNCIEFNRENTPPIWMLEYGIVITNFLNKCKTKAGRDGYKSNSEWTAMTFPCTAGKGKIDISGNYWMPKVVGFVLSSDCKSNVKMESPEVEKIAQKLGLTEASKPVAFNPFTTQFWELPGLVDSDTGFVIELRSPLAKQQFWRQFLEKNPLKVHLYGRENSWYSGDHIFSVIGHLTLTGERSFALKVDEIKALAKDELFSIKLRCESIKPPRNCNSIF